MRKSQKELAFLQDLYISSDWTERFTALIDENLNTKDIDEILFVNAGTGSYALGLEEKLDEETEMTCVCENEELLQIARAKADATKSKIDFRTSVPEGKFDAVVADASFIKPAELYGFLRDVTDSSRRQVAFFLPTAGSFGEIFSYLWQALLELDWLDKGAEIEHLITELPTVSRTEEIAGDLNLKNITSKTKNEIFEFENGAAFVASPLVADFLFPAWLGFLTENETEKLSEKLAQTIDAESEGLTFRFAVKTTLVVGEKAFDH